MKRALVIGIDDYPSPNELSGCVNDAREFGALLERNGDGSPNFATEYLTSNDRDITHQDLNEAIDKLFASEAETVLLFFAGHGGLDDNQSSGYLVAQDGTKAAPGPRFEDLLAKANAAHPNIRSVVIILDCCHSGSFGEVAASTNSGQTSLIGTGVTVLTACHRTETASEFDGHGLFTGILIDGLAGAAADLRGEVSPAALYSHVDELLGAWEQRPIYKANVKTFVSLKTVVPKIPIAALRALHTLFPEPEYVYPLDPSCEPNRDENTPAWLMEIEVDVEKAEKFKTLQSLNRVGLVVPYQAEHMFDAAIKSTGCRLTATGAHYRNMAEVGRI